MTEPTEVPTDDLRRVADAQRRFNVAIEGLDDATARRETPLPGWTVGHLLTHVARNADSHVRRIEAARQGKTIDQYVGGFTGRTREIEAGAGRLPDALVEDVVVSAATLEAAWTQVPLEAWAITSRDVNGTIRALHTLPSRRWQELEVHRVDLGLGPTHRDWPDEFVAQWLGRLRPSIDRRLPAGTSPPPPGALDERDELAWLYGRLRRADLPALLPWG